MDQNVKNQPQVPTEPTAKPSSGSLMHEFNTPGAAMPVPKVIFAIVLVLLLGLGSGFGITKMTATSVTGKSPLSKLTAGSNVEKGKTYGSTDTELYKDSVDGEMAEGGMDGEGQFHLVRPGGDSQNVYLTSSTVDLSEFIGRKVKVWGQTQKAQKVGWLMDVGGVKVLD